MKERLIKFIRICLIVCVLEVLVFNITSYRTFFGNFEKKEFSKEVFEVISSEENLRVKINNINMPVATIKVEFSNRNTNYEYFYEYSDATTIEHMRLPSKLYLSGEERTQYISCYLSGEVNSIIINVENTNGNENLIKKITINEAIPFEFNFVRVVILIGIILIMQLFKNSDIMNAKYEESNLKHEFILLGLLGIFLVLLTFINTNSKSFEAEDMYNKGLVEAFLNKSLSLLYEPSEEFLKLENPYDPLDRMNYPIYRGVDYLWDTAYYNGNFYVYFGVLPVLLIFLPFFVLTGGYLHCATAGYIISVIILILLKEIMCKLYKRYFPNLPFKLLVLSLATLYAGSLLLYINGCVRFYEIAIVSGVCCVLVGILFMLKAMENPERKYRFIFLSCLFMALSVACRPTNLISSIIIVPYLWKEFYEGIKTFKENKKTIFKIVSVIAIPYLIVAIPLMWYNYARFGSAFEFGAKYQITINDMRNLESRIFAIPVGLLCNLFSIPNFITEFPFVENHNELVSFNGFYYIENMIGGLFILAPICFFSFYVFKLHKKTENKELKNWIYALLIAGVLIAIISSAMGGSIQRYLFDYAWMFILAGILIFNVLYEFLKSQEAKNILMKIMGVITIYTILINISAGIVSEKSYFEIYSQELFHKIRYSISFWE